MDLRIDHTTDGALIADDLAKEGFPVAVGPSFGHATKYELRHKGFHTLRHLQKRDVRFLSLRIPGDRGALSGTLRRKGGI